MRHGNRRVVMAALLLLSAAVAPLHAADPLSLRVRAALAALRTPTPQDDSVMTRVQPQVIPSAGGLAATIDLRDVSRPFALESQLRPHIRTPIETLRLTITGGEARAGDYGLGSDQVREGNLLVLHGNTNISGTLRGNLVTYEGDVVLHAGARIEGSVVALHGAVRNDGATVTGTVRSISARALAQAIAREVAPRSPLERTMRNLAGVCGVFLSLLVLAWAIVFFARSNLEVASDTVRFSFPRALAVGLLGQMLAAPTFGMIVVGLVLSVAGILLVPFAVIAFGLLLIVTVLGGGFAAAHAMGDTIVRRRLALGAVGSPSAYRAVVVGLALPTSLWLIWACFSWVPIAGPIMLGTAALGSWFVWTAGFGAALLSRAGARENFAGRFLAPEALTDEYLWATPQFGVPAVKRPGAGEAPAPRTGSTTKSGSGRSVE
jgi:hypothetical protein